MYKIRKPLIKHQRKFKFNAWDVMIQHIINELYCAECAECYKNEKRILFFYKRIYETQCDKHFRFFFIFFLNVRFIVDINCFKEHIKYYIIHQQICTQSLKVLYTETIKITVIVR